MTPLLRRIVEALPESVQEDFNERAAIMEYDGGLDRDAAEREALRIVMRNR